jgi:hypothetical protein
MPIQQMFLGVGGAVSMIDQSEDWGSKITEEGITFDASASEDDMFDADWPATPSKLFRGAGGLKLTHTFTGVTSIRVCCYIYSTWNYFEVNGSSSTVLGTETTSNALATWNDLTVPAGGTVTSIEWGYTSTANYYCSGIEINDKLLVNDDIVDPDIPGYTD